MDYTVTALPLFWIFHMMNCSSEDTRIPQHLLECYKEPRPPLLPMTVDNLKEIIRKINFNSYSPLSLTQQIADILNWFAMDGLERSPNTISIKNVVPYHRTAFQAHKQDLLFEELIPVQRRVFDGISLSVSEKCTIHFMVSASVDYWERGDEAKVCPESSLEFRNMSADRSGGAGMYSVCPREGGVVLTPAGSVSVSRLLTGLMAATVPQYVPLSQLLTPGQLAIHQLLPTDTISNTWAATLAGDLAEVAVEQIPLYQLDVNIGISERWNDTNIPRQLYFNKVPFTMIEKQQWQITDAEILGGIDGLLLGNMIRKIQHSASSTMRLSQLLDMYYSEKSVAGTNVCNREYAFNTLMRENENNLLEQTKRFAALLGVKTTSYFTDSSIMAYRCINAVEKFKRYYHRLLVGGTCPLEHQTIPRLNLFVILDATWPPYTSLQFLMTLTQRVDIDYYGGSITIINGDSSAVRVNSTSQPTTLYQKMTLGKQNDPEELRLHRSFTALKNILEVENLREQTLSYPRKARQPVVVVMGYSSTVSDRDMRDSQGILRSIKAQNPELQMIYITSLVNRQMFRQLINVESSANSDNVLSTEDSQTRNVLRLIQSTVKRERSLKPAYCESDIHQWPEVWYNEYVTPSQTNTYWIHPNYLYGSLDIVKVTFKNYGYGELSVCMSRGDQRGDCKVARTDSDVTHAVLRPCATAASCQPLYFTVNVLRSFSQCAEYECRFENQVKFSIIVQDLHCINLNSDIGSRAEQNPLLACHIVLMQLLTSYLLVK